MNELMSKILYNSELGRSSIFCQVNFLFCRVFCL